MTLRDVVRSEGDYEGPYVSQEGEPQVAAFAYSVALRALVAVHVPQGVVEARVRQGAIPWAATLFVAGAALFPLGLILLDWGYRTAEAATRRVPERAGTDA